MDYPTGLPASLPSVEQSLANIAETLADIEGHLGVLANLAARIEFAAVPAERVDPDAIPDDFPYAGALARAGVHHLSEVPRTLGSVKALGLTGAEANEVLLALRQRSKVTS